MIEVIGYIGAICFALCAIPQAYMCYKDKHAHGLSMMSLMLWFWGEVFMILYTAVTIGYLNPLMLNYASSVLFLLIIIRYKLWPLK